MTQPKYTNADCPLYGSEYCAVLNMESCEKCTVECTDEEKTARVKQDLADMAALLPEDGMAKLFTGEECVLCKGEKGKREYYAFFDMGHPGARKHRAKGLLGLLKKEPRFGSLLPAQVSCCKECKQRMTRLSYVKGLIIAAFLLSGLIVLSLRSVNEPLMAITHGLPFYIFAAWAIIGIAVAEIAYRGMKRSYAKRTYLNVMNAPMLAELKEKGWFELFAEHGVSRLVFSKKPMSHGLFAAMPDEMINKDGIHGEKSENA